MGLKRERCGRGLGGSSMDCAAPTHLRRGAGALSKSPGNGAGTDCPGMETWYTGHELSKYQMISMEYGLKHQIHGQCRMATGCKL